MTQVLKTYNPANVQITWGGWVFNGYAEGTFVEASRNTDNTSMSEGADGSIGITKIPSRSGQITLTLQQNSPSNMFLSKVQLAQDASDEDIIRADMTVRDKSGSFLAYLNSAHIMTPTGFTLGDDQQPKTWTFYAERMDFADTIPEVGKTLGVAAEVNAAVENIKNISKDIQDL